MTQFFNSILFMLGEMAPYILLGFLIAGLLHAYVPREAMARHLSGHGPRAVAKAALLGIPLPLCSCGVLPTAIALRRNGASKASATSFLIATPQTGVDSIAATWSLLGPAFAIVRPVAALVTSFFGGIAVGKTEEAETQPSTISTPSTQTPHRLLSALRYGFVDLAGSIGTWLVAGLIIAALITVYVPADIFASLGDRPLVAMLAVLVVAVPMYVCATGSIPIAMSLVMKGLSPGTALVLLMAGPAANFASFTLISREFGKRAAITYLVSIIVGALAFGLAVDYLMPASWFALGDMAHAACHGHAAEALSPFSMVCAAVLALLLLYSVVRRFIHPHNHHAEASAPKAAPTCPHCHKA